MVPRKIDPINKRKHTGIHMYINPKTHFHNLQAIRNEEEHIYGLAAGHQSNNINNDQLDIKEQHIESLAGQLNIKKQHIQNLAGQLNMRDEYIQSVTTQLNRCQALVQQSSAQKNNLIFQNFMLQERIKDLNTKLSMYRSVLLSTSKRNEMCKRLDAEKK